MDKAWLEQKIKECESVRPEIEKYFGKSCIWMIRNLRKSWIVSNLLVILLQYMN